MGFIMRTKVSISNAETTQRDFRRMQTYDLIVIGGGLAGVATAYFAARRGAQVLLLERADLNLAASGSNAGSIHAQIPFEPFLTLGGDWAARYAETIPLFMASIARWAELEQELGRPLGVETKGGLMVAATAEDMGRLEQKAGIERAAGLPVELWSPGDLARHAPFLSPGLAGGAFCPIEGKADPFRAVPALAEAAAEQGATIRRHAPVTGIERAADGFVVISGSDRYRGRRVVNAAGAEAARIAAMLGVTVAVEGHAIQVAVTEKRPPILPYLVYYTAEKLTLKQAGEGGFLIGGGWPAQMRGTPQVDGVSMLRNLAVAQTVLPALAGADVVRSWAAVVNGTADWRPILGEAPGVPGFYLNLFPWMGFTAAPAVSEALADLALGLSPELDLGPFALTG